MLLLDALVRVSSVSMLLLLAIDACLHLRWSRSWLFLALACVSTAALLLSLSSQALSLPFGAAELAGFLNIPHLILIWLFALSVFQTDFRLSFWHLIAGLVYVVPIAWFRAYQFDWIDRPPFWLSIGVSVGSIALVGHLVWQILHEKQEDLIWHRRNLREAFVWTLVTVTIGAAVTDLYLIEYAPAWAGLMKASIIWPAVLAAFLWLYRAPDKSYLPSASRSDPAAKSSRVGAKDAELLGKLDALMRDERAYLDPDLTVAGLAKRLGVTSHRLRELINQTLGHENFSQYVNRFRIGAIQDRLDDPSNDQVPILTIALEGGFSSISPFNRAFKRVIGCTPTVYRKQTR